MEFREKLFSKKNATFIVVKKTIHWSSSSIDKLWLKFSLQNRGKIHAILFVCLCKSPRRSKCNIKWNIEISLSFKFWCFNLKFCIIFISQSIKMSTTTEISLFWILFIWKFPNEVKWNIEILLSFKFWCFYLKFCIILISQTIKMSTTTKILLS